MLVAVPPAEQHAQSAVSGVFFSDAKTGTVVGGRGAILRTTDRGNTWLSQLSGTTNFLFGVAFLDANTGIAVGLGGTILRANTGWQFDPIEIHDGGDRSLPWANTKDQLDLVLRAALAHLWFVTIHPFYDGNGRIARAIADWALARSSNSSQRFYSMSAQIQ